MKIFGIINNLKTNYSDSPSLESPNNSYFFIPDTSLLKSGRPFFLPLKTGEFCLAPSIVIKIDKVGKNISERFSYRYYNELALGGLIFNKHLLRSLSQQGLPLTPALAYDYNAPISLFFNKEVVLQNSIFEIFINENKELSFSVSDTISQLDSLIAGLSRYNTLKTGDLIFANITLTDVKLNLNSKMTIKHNNNLIFSSNIK